MAGGQLTAAAFLVAELRRARVRQGWSQEELARAVNYSPSMVSAVELGQQPPTSKYLDLFDKALDTGGIFGRMLTDLVALDKAQVWQRGWRTIVGQASKLRWFEPIYVPGLLQTEAYARAVFESGDLLAAEEVTSRLTDRIESQNVLYGDRPPQIIAILDEGVLRRLVGSRKIMADQATHLARVATEHPKVTVHVVSRSGEEYPALGGGFVVATLRDGGELGCLGGQVKTHELQEAAALDRLHAVWEATLGLALPPQDSIRLIREVAESWA
ncbi:helix-turn-helix transcriptional regulator [Micromonospora andamanensis]|uniref:helix-turn-helix domain-containing protein n=1 Tax=Micromonospora andamanensis TaxID=1287068 RepID=UPI00194ED890|nr:helix-turn-helix transcriptional regulator [Micromonospora andamanensis]GIJ37683.1 transcriptional regulator [Micromonospora andamanensis]